MLFKNEGCQSVCVLLCRATHKYDAVSLLEGVSASVKL